MSIEETPRGKISLYGAGGAGINLVSSWNDAHNDHATGQALLQVSYVDTSKSNLPTSVNPETVYVLDGVDGSGKIRSENHVEISRNIRSVLQKHAPGDLSVVVFSASGGSGSVFGPLLMAELISTGNPVVGVVVGSEESKITTENTLKTLKTLEHIAQSKGVPVVISYHHNKAGTKRSDNDKAARRVMATLSVLASRRNTALDTKDIANWLEYTRVAPAIKPQLSLLHVYDQIDDVQNATRPISIAALLKDPDEPTFDVPCEYETTGYPKNWPDGFNQLFFVINVDGVPVVEKMVKDRLEGLEKASASRVTRDSMVDGKDNIVGDLIL